MCLVRPIVVQQVSIDTSTKCCNRREKSEQKNATSLLALEGKQLADCFEWDVWQLGQGISSSCQQLRDFRRLFIRALVAAGIIRRSLSFWPKKLDCSKGSSRYKAIQEGQPQAELLCAARSVLPGPSFCSGCCCYFLHRRELVPQKMMRSDKEEGCMQT